MELKIVKNSTFKRISPVFNTGLLIYYNNNGAARSIIDSILFLKTILESENSILLLYCKVNSLYLSVDSLEGFIYSFNCFAGMPLIFLVNFFLKYFFSTFFILFKGFKRLLR
jgi:hypothetical protein